MENALPAGTNHHAASDALAKETDDMANAARGTQTAPRPAGTTATATVQLPMKSSRSTTAK
jgi:hypothetical protein